MRRTRRSTAPGQPVETGWPRSVIETVPTLRTSRLLLTIPGPECAPQYARFCLDNADFLQPWQGPFFEREFQASFWSDALRRRTEAFHADQRYSFGIFAKSAGVSGPLLGYCSFSEIIRGRLQSCYLGYALAENAQGRGLMTEALRVAIAYMFGEARLHRIMANYMPRNERSAKLLGRLGFAVEGAAKKYLYINGAWQDHVMTALVNPRESVPAGVAG